MAPDIDQSVSRQVVLDVDDAAASVKRAVVKFSRRFIYNNATARTGVQADNHAMPTLNVARVFTSERIEWSGALGHLYFALEFPYIVHSRHPWRVRNLAA